MNTGKTKLNICARVQLMRPVLFRSSHPQGLQYKPPVKTSVLELGLRDSDGAHTAGTFKARINQTLKTILWDPSPVPAQGKAESMTSQGHFFILSLDFKQEE